MMQSMPEGAPEQAQAQGGGAASQLITGISSDMKKLGKLLQGADGVDPAAVEELGQVIQAYEAVMEKIAGGGADEEKSEAAPAGVSSPEAGANPNARPM